MLVKNLFTAFIALLVSSAVLANATKSPESVLTPGAKLVAGDTAQDEFFIIGQGEEMQINPVITPDEHINIIKEAIENAAAKNASQDDVIQEAVQNAAAKNRGQDDVIQEAIENAAAKNASQDGAIKDASKKDNTKQVMPAESSSPNTVSYKHKNKVNISKIKVALKRTIHKVSSQKAASHIKTALRHTKHKVVAKKVKLHKVSHQVVSKKKISKVKIVGHQTHHKVRSVRMAKT